MYKHMKKLAVVLTGLGLLAGCSGGAEPARQQGKAPEVGVIEIKPSHVVLTTELVGRTASYLQAEVRPQARGIIRERLFVEGGDVAAGQVLYQIEPDSYQAAFDNSKAALAKSEANREVTRLRANRVAELRKTNAVSQQDHDDAQAAYLQAQAEVASSRAALDNARIDLNRTRITAPISGRISKSSVTVGALVTAEQATALATIHQVNPMYVDVTKAAEDVLKLRQVLRSNSSLRKDQGQAPVRLYQSDGTEYPYPGTLRFTDVGVNEATGTVTLRAEFPNPEHALLPGLYVRAVLTEGEDDNALLVPLRSVMRDSRGNPQVLVVNAEGNAERRVIRTGKSFGENWMVLEGLQLGDKVIVEGLQKVQPGRPVRPVPYVSETANAASTEPKAAGASTPGKAAESATPVKSATPAESGKSGS